MNAQRTASRSWWCARSTGPYLEATPPSPGPLLLRGRSRVSPSWLLRRRLLVAAAARTPSLQARRALLAWRRLLRRPRRQAPVPARARVRPQARLLAGCERLPLLRPPPLLLLHPLPPPALLSARRPNGTARYARVFVLLFAAASERLCLRAYRTPSSSPLLLLRLQRKPNYRPRHARAHSRRTSAPSCSRSCGSSPPPQRYRSLCVVELCRALACIARLPSRMRPPPACSALAQLCAACSVIGGGRGGVGPAVPGPSGARRTASAQGLFRFHQPHATSFSPKCRQTCLRAPVRLRLRASV